MNQPLRIFLGYDSQEPVTFAVAMHSILKRASRPIAVTPLVQPALRADGIYTRERHATESTEFSLTRFLAPWLCDFQGYSLFLDSDVLVRCDIWDILLYALARPEKAVHVVQHDYTPTEGLKFDGHVQTVYPKKNWSSVMLFNNANCRMLTAEYVNRASGLDLHRFNWLVEAAQQSYMGIDTGDLAILQQGMEDATKAGTIQDFLIGNLPPEWNHLVGEYPPNANAKILHYTNGAPCFPAYAHCDQADLWMAEYAEMLRPGQAVEAAATEWRQKYGALFDLLPCIDGQEATD